MAGLQGWLGGRVGQQKDTSRAPTYLNEGRASAQSLKINHKDKSSALSKKSRNTSQEPQHYAQNYHHPAAPQPHHKERLDIESVDDNFDKTMSERQFNQQHDEEEPIPGKAESDAESEDLINPESEGQESLEEPHMVTGGQYQEDHARKIEPVVPHTRGLRHSSGSPNIKRQQVPNPAVQGQSINGRFDNHNMPIRNQQENDNSYSPSPKPKKRSRSIEPDHQNYPAEQEYYRQQPEHQPKRDHHSRLPVTARPLTPNGAGHNGEADRTPRQHAGPAGGHVPNEPNIQGGAQFQEPQVPLDYSEEELQNMTFAELSKESWEVGIDDSPDDRPLTDRLQEIMNDVVPGEQNHVPMEFFSKMPTSEWDETGEWFVEQFSEIMQAMISKRKERRTITTEYENELMQREKAVRGKSNDLEKKFADMRAGGEHLLKGKV